MKRIRACLTYKTTHAQHKMNIMDKRLRLLSIKVQLKFIDFAFELLYNTDPERNTKIKKKTKQFSLSFYDYSDLQSMSFVLADVFFFLLRCFLSLHTKIQTEPQNFWHEFKCSYYMLYNMVQKVKHKQNVRYMC